VRAVGDLVGQSQSDGLVAAEPGIQAAGCQDVAVVPTLLMPEATLEGGLRALRHEAEPLRGFGLAQQLPELRGDHESVEPQGSDLHWLSGAGGDNPVAHLGIHPGELVIRIPLAQQAVLRVYLYPVEGSSDVPVDAIGQGGPEARHEVATLRWREGIDHSLRRHKHHEGGIDGIVVGRLAVVGEAIGDDALAHVRRETLDDGAG